MAWILSAATGFMSYLYGNHQAEKEKLCRNRKNRKDTVKREKELYAILRKHT